MNWSDLIIGALIGTAGATFGSVLTVAGYLFVPYIQERLGRQTKIRQRREDAYLELTKNLWSFFAPNKEIMGDKWEEVLLAKTTFIVQASWAQLYTSVPVAKYLKDFNSVTKKEQHIETPEDGDKIAKERKEATNKLLKAMRKDLGISTESDEDIFEFLVPVRGSNKKA